MSVGVSVDTPLGAGDYNLRSYKNGGLEDVSSIVWKNVAYLCEKQIKIALTAVVTQKNVYLLSKLLFSADVMGNISGIGLDLLKLKGGAKDCYELLPPCDMLEMGISSMLEAEAFLHGKNPYAAHIRESATIRMQIRRNITRYKYCHACTGECIALAPDGSLFPCASFIGDSRFNMGNIENIDTFDDIMSQNPCLGRDARDIEECKTCDIAWLCGAGCPARAFYNAGGILKPYELDCLMRRTIINYIKRKSGDKVIRNAA